jgi:hypothetical protein
MGPSMSERKAQRPATPAAKRAKRKAWAVEESNLQPWECPRVDAGRGKCLHRARLRGLGDAPKSSLRQVLSDRKSDRRAMIS